MNKKSIGWSIFILFSFIFLIAFFYYNSTLLISPSNIIIGSPPDALNAVEVSFNSKSGSKIKGWFINGVHEGVGIILLHGNNSNRRSMIERAKFLNYAGYSVLLFDFQAHGESIGNYKTFGYLETLDVEAAINYLYSRYCINKVGIIGVSLGGAASVLAYPKVKADAYVLESVYSTIEDAVSNRLKIKLGFTCPIFTKFFIFLMQLRIEINPKDLRPVDTISKIKAPVLIIAGTNDRRTTLDESKIFYSKAQNPKELWMINKAAHIDFHQYKNIEYESRILKFFSKYLLKY